MCCCCCRRRRRDDLIPPLFLHLFLFSLPSPIFLYIDAALRNDTDNFLFIRSSYLTNLCRSYKLYVFHNVGSGILLLALTCPSLFSQLIYRIIFKDNRKRCQIVFLTKLNNTITISLHFIKLMKLAVFLFLSFLTVIN